MYLCSIKKTCESWMYLLYMYSGGVLNNIFSSPFTGINDHFNVDVHVEDLHY